MAGARAVGAAGGGWGSSYAGSAGQHSFMRVGPRCEGRLRPGTLPPPAALLLGPVGARCPRAVGTGVRVRGPALSPWPVFPVFLRGDSRGFAARVSVVRGVCSQALPLTRLSAPGRAVGVRHPLLLWARVCRCWGLALSPRLACPVGAALRGGGGGRPLGGGPPPLREASGVRCCPSPGRPPSGRAVGVRPPHAVGAGVRMWGPGTVPSACMPRGSCVPRGWWGGAPRGGGLPPLRGASGVRRCPSPSRRPSLAGSRGSATRVSQVRSVLPWGPSTGPTACALRAGVARRGGGGRASPGGCLPLSRGASEFGRSPSPNCPPTGRAVGVHYPHAVGTGV